MHCDCTHGRGMHDRSALSHTCKNARVAMYVIAFTRVYTRVDVYVSVVARFEMFFSAVASHECG